MKRLDGMHNRTPAENGWAGDGEHVAQSPNGKPGVLVVDDDHMVRNMVQLGLERSGFDVWKAPNGQEAIELYQTHRASIGVVLLDIRMPILDGPTTLKALRDLNPRVLACFMSGDPGAFQPEDLLRHGAVGVIAKPFRLTDLASILRLLTQADPPTLGNGYRVGADALGS